METILFDFNQESDLSGWYVVDDGVMGGRSEGQFYLSKQGHGIFSGDVSLENNGGFSSIRYQFAPKNISLHEKIMLKVKGDGKNYQLRVKSKLSEWHSYKAEFTTSGEWQIIEVSMKNMVPTFRGRQLRMDNYPGKFISEFAILIGNKKAENFKLEIDYIKFK